MEQDSRKALDVTVIRRSTLVNLFINASSFIFANKYLKISGLDPLLYGPLFSLLSFVLDVFFVQLYFRTPESKLVQVPYHDYLTRSRSLWNRNILMKAIVVQIIAQVVQINLSDYIMSVLRQIRAPVWKYTSLCVNSFSGVFIGVLVVNMLKFRWAYIDVTESNLNAIILAWFSIVLMLHLLRAVIKNNCPDERSTRRERGLV